MLEYLVVALFLLFLYVFYRFSYTPKAEIKRYKAILQKLGYKVYEQPFAFMNLSIMQEFDKGKQLHKDAQYYQRTVYPQVDVCLGNVLDKVSIDFVQPNLIKEVLSPNYLNVYPKSYQMVQGLKIAFGEGLGFTEGQQWKRKRKLFSKIFNFDLIKENIDKMSQICDRFYDLYDSQNKQGNNVYKYDICKMSTRIFSGIMMKCFLGSDQVKDQVKGLTYQQFLVETISDLTLLTLTPIMVFIGKIAWNFGLTTRIRQAKESVHIMRSKAEEILKIRTEKIKSQPKSDKITDVIQALIYQKMENKQDYSYSDKELVDDFISFLLAGTDTTTKYFTMIVYYIGKNPHVHKKLREQVNSIIKNDSDINYDNLKKLNYIDWIQFETTRMFGPANLNFWRVAAEDNNIKDIPVSKGTIVNIQPRGNHYNPTYFKDPNVFRPERWESECDNIHPYSFMGFSGGPRSCLGKQLAHLQSKIALVKLIKRYETISVPDEITMSFTFLYEALPFDTTFTKVNAK